jgi:uncharacterized protein YbjT (DUF2867 family)
LPFAAVQGIWNAIVSQGFEAGMKDKLVTLIGGGGFIGRYVAHDLLRAGARLRIVQRSPKQAYRLKTQAGLGDIQFMAGDVTRPDSLAAAMAGADAAVNLVGAWRNVQAIQADGAENVAKAAAAAGVGALVQISAIGADAASPAAYARSKAEGEQRARAAYPAVTILRPTTVFGREDQFTNRFAAMLEKPVMPVVRASTRFQPVYVADVAAAVRTALADPETHGGKTYELGGPDVMTMEALLHWLAQATGRSPCFVRVPDAVAGLLAGLPGAPITRDQWLLLQQDAVVSSTGISFDVLGIEPTPMASVAPSWLVLYRRAGRFGTIGAAA